MRRSHPYRLHNSYTTMNDEQTEAERLVSRLLHFEDDDPGELDIPFVNLSDALVWLRKMGYDLGEWEGVADTEEWIPTGWIEERLDVYEGFNYVGQLIRLRKHVK